MERPDLSFSSNVKSPEQFPQWREQALDFYKHALKYKGCPAQPLESRYTEEKKVADRVKRYRVEYSTSDGLMIPAYLFTPDAAGKFPVVIVYHGHGDGKINAAEREGTNENALALYLAEKLGYVVLAPDSRSFGEFDIPKSNKHIDYYYSLISKGKLYMEKLMEDSCRDIEFLRTVEKADLSELGAAGISMGSWRTMNFAALHDDVKAAVIAGLYIPWDYLFSAKHCMCQHVPAAKSSMGMEDLAATIFPRSLLIQWGLKDAFHEMGAESLIDRTKKIADTLGYGSSFVVDRHRDMGHSFSNPEAAKFFSDKLGPGAWPFDVKKSGK